MSYNNFLVDKLQAWKSTGIDNHTDSEYLFDFQNALTRWGLSRGRSAIFADTGLGKTRMQLSWADHVYQQVGPVIILAPLAVADQTVKEGQEIGIDVVHQKEQGDVPPITITNYERMHKFDMSKYSGVVLDESSCIKHHDTRRFMTLCEELRDTPYKLCATATPAPNDWTELGTHAEFLGICSRSEMLSEYFVHDGGETQKWRLKGHAQKIFWEWVSSWGALVRNPADLGFDGAAYQLPKLSIQQHTIYTDQDAPEGFLFAMEANTLSERRSARRQSVDERVNACAEMVNSHDGPSVVWCELNTESEMLTKAINDAVEVRGSMTIEEKESRIMGFSNGDYKVIVTKPSIAGFGLNWQHSHNMAFVGVTDSFESYYQSVRRCWRFGQEKPVTVHIFASELEGAVVSNLQRKERDALLMSESLSALTKESVKKNIFGIQRSTNEYNADETIQLPKFIGIKK